jgi:hypothetical protein
MRANHAAWVALGGSPARVETTVSAFSLKRVPQQLVMRFGTSSRKYWN